MTNFRWLPLPNVRIPPKKPIRIPWFMSSMSWKVLPSHMGIYGDYNKPIIRIAINQSGFPMVQPSAVLEPLNWGGWESHARTLHSELTPKTSGTEKMEVFVVQVLRYYPVQVSAYLLVGFRHLLFSPLFGEMIQFEDHIIFSDGLKPPTSYLLSRKRTAANLKMGTPWKG